MLNLLRLSYLTGNHELEEKADILSRVFAEKVNIIPKVNKIIIALFFIKIHLKVLNIQY